MKDMVSLTLGEVQDAIRSADQLWKSKLVHSVNLVNDTTPKIGLMDSHDWELPFLDVSDLHYLFCGIYVVTEKLMPSISHFNGLPVLSNFM